MTAIAVTIAGSDSGGGAGIQADLKTFSALGVYGASIVTAITAQNTQGVSGIHDVPPAMIAAQIDAVFADLAVNAVKIGMLSSAVAIGTVAAGLERWKQTSVVLDPVMIATSGDRLLAPEATHALIRDLFPRALLVTPNLAEAAALTGTPLAQNEDEMRAQALRLVALGANAVLIKGGHAPTVQAETVQAVDLLVTRDAVARFTAEKIATKNTHGTGCTLSSAIAAGLAKGVELSEAVTHAKAYVTAAIAAADELAVGHGHGPVHHFHAYW
jgi:hydroxymethylpyrimidine/phosphomethylpyrimidine kinase